MTAEADFEADSPAVAGVFLVDLEGFEGPIDLLLQLARDQKVDLTQISILQLSEQYIAFVKAARRVNLELAADYLVMAAWLAYLKSRLLLPEPEGEDEPSGAEMAAALRFQLQRLEAMQGAGVGLLERPRLGRDFFARGAPEAVPKVTNVLYQATLYDLLSAYGRTRGRATESDSLRILPLNLYSVDDAMRRLTSLLGAAPGWRTLASFLPPELRSGLPGRSALASTLLAGLEMVKEGKAELRQEGHFRPIYLREKESCEKAPAAGRAGMDEAAAEEAADSWSDHE